MEQDNPNVTTADQAMSGYPLPIHLQGLTPGEMRQHVLTSGCDADECVYRRSRLTEHRRGQQAATDLRVVCLSGREGAQEVEVFTSREQVAFHLRWSNEDYRETVLAWLDATVTELDINSDTDRKDHWVQERACPVTRLFNCQYRGCELHYTLAPVKLDPANRPCDYCTSDPCLHEPKRRAVSHFFSDYLDG